MRYLPLTDADRQDMLAAIGAASVDDLFRDVPPAARIDRIALPDHSGELQVERDLARMAAKNLAAGSVPSFLGAGNYRHHVPAAVDYLIQRGEFMTSYTPYQPEIAQGTLQYLFEFQTQVALITGMDVANASMYDGATSCAEAAVMACRVTKRSKILLSGGLHPHYRAVTETQTRFTDMQTDAPAPDPMAIEDLIGRIDSQTACVVVQNPSFFGHLKDLAPLAKACHEAGALLVVAVTDITSLGLVQSPGDMGADIVVAEGQGIGNALNFGGPGLGLFATKQKFLRQMPGRLCGQTVDAEGKRGYVLTLSTREQHIRREKATSNICTNSGLCALAFTIHMSLLGEVGFTRLAEINHANAAMLAEKLTSLPNLRILPKAFYNEIAVVLNKPANGVVEDLVQRGILGGVPASRFYPNFPELDDVLLLAATETNTVEDMDALVAALKEIL